jgi:hypothetical protein
MDTGGQSSGKHDGHLTRMEAAGQELVRWSVTGVDGRPGQLGAHCGHHEPSALSAMHHYVKYILLLQKHYL